MDKDLAKIEAAFRPVGRLFLSADLVGSTAHKQRASFPIAEDGSSWPDDDLSPPWLLPISDFFAQFGRVFKASWDEVCSAATGKKIPCGDPPELWKANGDELIFVKELDDRRELYVCLCAWISAVQNYRKNLQKGGLLDIKSTAWFAGFPITNSEVIFWRDLSDDDKEYQDDSRLNQIHLREIWHKKQKNKNNKLIRDFIGPTIDTGFRLTSFSTIRKMVISLDVAYLAATAMMPPDIRSKPIFKWLDIVYDGRFPLKGVMNGIPYPRFWIDMIPETHFIKLKIIY